MIKELYVYKVPPGFLLTKGECYRHLIKFYNPHLIGGVCHLGHLFLTVKLDPEMQIMRANGIRPYWLTYKKTLMIEKKARYRRLLVDDIFSQGIEVARYYEEDIIKEVKGK